MSYTTATGRRKAAIARVYLSKGKGKITVNNKDFKEYFPVEHLALKVTQPLVVLDMEKKYDVKVNVKGGGVKGQAEAISLGIARALVKENEENRAGLKEDKLLRRDSRVVERKKVGKKKARKNTQFSKR